MGQTGLAPGPDCRNDLGSLDNSDHRQRPQTLHKLNDEDLSTVLLTVLQLPRAHFKNAFELKSHIIVD